MNRAIQTVTSELNRLLEAKDNLIEFSDALWDAGIKLEPEIMGRAKETVETEICKEIVRIKAELKGLL
jgi:hypothetical protein